MRITTLAFATLLASTSAQAVNDNPLASIAIVGPDGGTFTDAEHIAAPFAVKVVDANGAPMGGVVVEFFTNVESTVDGQPPWLAPPYGMYGTFDDPEHYTVTTGADGVATAPAYTAGVVAGAYDIAAYVSPQAAVPYPPLSALFHVTQVPLATRVPITSAFSGTWYDPAQSGHGIMIEVLPDNRLLAFWFTFSPDDTSQAWFGDVGTIANDVASVRAYTVTNAAFIPNFDPTQAYRYPWGDLIFSFSDCNHGRVDFDTWSTAAVATDEWGWGHMDLTRLTLPAGLSCD